jgi:hypothetical protein
MCGRWRRPRNSYSVCRIVTFLKDGEAQGKRRGRLSAMNVKVHVPRSPKAPALDLVARGLGRARPRRRSTATTTAMLHAEIVHADTASLRELPPQQRTECLDPGFDHVDAQANLAGDEALPVFEPARVVTDDVSVCVGLGSDFEIDEGWFEHSDRVAPHVEKARAAGPAQILAARGREHVAADPPHIGRELVVQRTRAVRV